MSVSSSGSGSGSSFNWSKLQAIVSESKAEKKEIQASMEASRAQIDAVSLASGHSSILPRPISNSEDAVDSVKKPSSTSSGKPSDALRPTERNLQAVSFHSSRIAEQRIFLSSPKPETRSDPVRKPSTLERLNAQIDVNHHNGKRELATRQQILWGNEFSKRQVRDLSEGHAGVKRSNTYTHPSDISRPAKAQMKTTKEQFLDDSHAHPSSREFPAPRQFSPPEKARGLEPETKMNRVNLKDARSALVSHAAGAKHRQASGFWRAEKSEPKTSVQDQITDFFFKPNDLATKPSITVQRKTGSGTKDPNDLSKGETFVYKNSEQVGISFAKRAPEQSHEDKSFVGFLEPTRRKT